MDPSSAMREIRKRPAIPESASSVNGSSAKRRRGGPMASSQTLNSPERDTDTNIPVKVKSEKPAWRKSFPHRPYKCIATPYGCSSTFASKNELKRHISTQHLRLGFYRCDACPSQKPNDFNRKDLFTQHLRRMHPIIQPAQPADGVDHFDDSEDRQLAAAAERCYVRLRSLPDGTNCVFCGQIFEGPDSWNSNLEHVAKHMEQPGGGDIDPKDWKKNEALESWLINENLVEASGERWILREGGSDSTLRTHSNSIKAGSVAKPKRRASEVLIAPTPKSRRESITGNLKSETKRIESAPLRGLPPPSTSASAPTLSLITTSAPALTMAEQSPQLSAGDGKRITRNRDYRSGLSDESLQALGLHRQSDGKVRQKELTRQPRPDADRIGDSESEIDEQSDELLNRIAAFGDYDSHRDADDANIDDDGNENPHIEDTAGHTARSFHLPQVPQPPNIQAGDESVRGLIEELHSRVRAMTWWADSALFASQWRPATALATFLRSRSRSCPCPSSNIWPLSSPVDGVRGRSLEKDPPLAPAQEGPHVDAGLTNGHHVESTTQHTTMASDQPEDKDAKTRQDLLSLRDQVIALEQRLNLPHRQSAVESTLGMVWGQLSRKNDPETWPNALLFNLVQSVAPNVITSTAVSLPGQIRMSIDDRGPIVSKLLDDASAGGSDKDDHGHHSRIDSAYSSAVGT